MPVTDSRTDTGHSIYTALSVCFACVLRSKIYFNINKVYSGISKQFLVDYIGLYNNIHFIYNETEVNNSKKLEQHKICYIIN